MTQGRPRLARVARGHLAVACILALVFALWRILMQGGVTDLLEDRLADLRFQLRGAMAAPESVILVAIDEESVERLGWTPPPRGALAEAVERIAAAGPAAIALDLLFLESTAAGRELAGALGRTEGTILGAALSNRPDRGEERPPEIESLLERSVLAAIVSRDRAVPERPPPSPPPSPPPRPPLRLVLPGTEFAGGDALAHVNIVRSSDRVARELPLALWIGGERFLPAMALEAARRLGGLGRGEVLLDPGRSVTLGGRVVPVSRANAITINHLGPRGTVPTVSLVDLLDGKVPAERLAGRAVFVGASAETLSDLFATPFGSDVPGAEIMATVAANLHSGSLIVDAPSLHALGAVLAVLFAALAFHAANLGRLEAAFAAVPAVWLAGLGTVQLAFSEWMVALDVTTMLGALFFATSWTAAQRFRAQRRLSEALEEERGRLSRYVSPLLAERLAAGDFPERRAQDAAVLFVDVAGFTTIAEGATPEGTAGFLAGLHRLYERCASAHGGVISGFDGDGAMVMFGLPEPTAADAARALACGRMLLEEAGRFDSDALAGAGLSLRVSVHFGPVTAAVVGGARHAQLTLTGDTVNVASRLQEIAKQQGVALVASRAALDAAREGGSELAGVLVPLADQPIRGRTGRIEVWALPRPA